MLLEYKNRNDVDMSDWDIDDDTGALAHVVWPIKAGFLYKITIKIECEINPWAKENIEGDWFYTYEAAITKNPGNINYQEAVFYFEKVEDAFLFKLTWG